MTVTFLEDLTLFRDDFTYEELQELLLFFVKKVLVDFDYQLQPRVGVGPPCVFLMLRSMLSDDMPLTRPEIYNETMLGSLGLVLEVAPEVLRERMEPILFLYRQKVADEKEKDARRKLDGHVVDNEYGEYGPYDGMFPGYA